MQIEEEGKSSSVLDRWHGFPSIAKAFKNKEEKRLFLLWGAGNNMYYLKRLHYQGNSISV